MRSIQARLGSIWLIKMTANTLFVRCMRESFEGACDRCTLTLGLPLDKLPQHLNAACFRQEVLRQSNSRL
jgi:hypothetical protein